MRKQRHRADRWVLLGLVLLLSPAKTVEAQDAEQASLFLSTSPIRARVAIDGSLLGETTPIYLRAIFPGKHRITIVKEDYEGYTQELDFSQGETKTVHIDLEQQSFDTSFPSEQIVFRGSEGLESAEAYRFPHGRYAYRVEDGDLHVTPVFPNDGLLTAMNISIPVCVAISALLTVNDLLFPPDSGLPLSPTTLSAYGITAGVIGVDVVLHLKKRRFVEDAQKKIQSSRLGYHLAQEHYEKGQEMLSQNRMSEALENYTWIIQNSRESLYFPYTLYQIARIHYIQGESELALREFELIINQFPLSDLYDKSLKTLADLHYAAGDYNRSLDLLDSMVFLDPLYSREEIEKYRNVIREQL